MLASVFGFLGGLLKPLYLPILAYFKGRDDVKADNNEKTIKNIEKANSAIGRVKSHADKLRDKYLK